MLQIVSLCKHCVRESINFASDVQLKKTSTFSAMVMAAKTNMHVMRPTDRSKVARAMGKLQYQDEDLCKALVRTMRGDLHESPPIAVAGIMAGLGMVAYRCAHWLTRYCSTESKHMQVLRPKLQAERDDSSLVLLCSDLLVH